MTVRTIERVGGRHRGDHVGASYREPAELVALAVPFLAEGLALGDRVTYVGADAHDEVLAELDRTMSVDRALADGRMVVIDVTELPPPDPDEWPVRAAELVRSLTVAAVDDGFRGLRAVTDNTPHVTGPDARRAYLRAEHLVDRLCRELPYTALCAYDAGRLPADAVDQLVGAHSLVRLPGPELQLSASASAHLALAGSIDRFTVDHLEALLDAALRPPVDDPLVIDATDLDFTSHHGLVALDAHAARVGTTIELWHRLPGLERLAGILELDAVAVVGPPAAPRA